MAARPPRSPFRHPWYAYAFLTDALLANLVLVLARIGASQVPLWGPLLHFFIWLGIYVYAFECLHASANGRSEPPVIKGMAAAAAMRGHLRIQALVLIGLALVARFVGPTAAAAWIVLLSVWLPAALLSMFARHSAWAGYDPRNWVPTVGLVGPGYLALVAASAVVLLVQTFAAQLIPVSFGVVIGVALFYFIAHALVLTLFHLLGRCAWDFRDALDFAVEAPVLPVNRMRRDDADQLAAIEKRFLMGEADAARAELAAAVATGGPAVQRRYRAQLLAEGNRQALLEHARRYIGQLLALDETREALALLADSLRDDPDFVPTDSDDGARLIPLALRHGLRDTALQLARNTCRRYPRRQRPFDAVDAALQSPDLADPAAREPWLALAALRPPKAGDG